ncbi:hypothetical protein Tco_1340816 [Tanacetum coccineum]
MLTQQLELYKEKVQVFEITKEKTTNYFNEYIEADRKVKRFKQESQSQFIRDRDIIRDLEQQRDKLDLNVLDTVLNLEAKVKKNVDTVLKIGNSLQGMFMLGPKPILFYDSKLKHGLGYANTYTLKKAISQNPKLYDASCLDDSKICMNIRDTKDILEDATKSQIKMKNKMKDPIVIEKKQNVSTIDYKKLNALYEDFVLQKKLSAEQKYFPPSFISPEDPTNESLTYSSSETQPTKKQMPSPTPILVDLNQMENDFQTLFELLQTKSKQLEIFQKRFLRDIKEMKDVFESTESDLYNNMKDEIEKVQRDSIEIQEGMQKRINILEDDVQRCQKQSLDFELKLKHEKEK